MRLLRHIVGVVVLLAAWPAFAGSITIASSPTTAVAMGGTFTCPGAGACFVNVADLIITLATGDVTVSASGAGADILVADAVSWNSDKRLILNAPRHIIVNANISAANGALTLRADASCATAGDIIAMPTVSIVVTTLAYYHGTLTPDVVTPGKLTAFQLIDSTAELSALPATGSFALGCDVTDLGGYVPVPTFGGSFDGLGHAVISLLIPSATASAGLFAALDGATVSNLVLVRPAVTSTAGAVGSLAGSAKDATITDIAVLDAVIAGGAGTGGVVGVVQTSVLDRLYVSGAVTGGNDTGGVVGSIDGAGLLIGNTASLANAMSRARVTGATRVGGIAGSNGVNGLVTSTISDSWSAGAVSGTSQVGGAVGDRGLLLGVVTSVYWDTQTSGVATSAGGTGRTTAQMHLQANFSGFDFAGTWAIRANVSRPFLVSMQRLLDVTVAVSGNSPTTITEQATFTSTVTPRAGYGLPSGLVRFTDGASVATGVAIGDGTLAAGTASVSTTVLGVGIHTINAIFDGNAYHLENNASISHTVNAGSTTTTLTNPDGPIVATVTALPPATGVPTGSVTFNVDGGNLTPVTLVGGVANLDPSTLGAGVHTVIATFTSDDGRFATSTSGSIQVTVVGPTTTTLTQSVAASQLGEAFTLNATVSSSDGTPLGAVRFVADGVNIIAEVALASGGASASITSLSAGPHVLIAQFLPSTADFTASVSTQLSHDIAKADSETHLIVADVHDGLVTLNVEVAAVAEGLPAASGEVAIAIDGTYVGDPPLDGDGNASFVSAQLTGGSHTITAHYDGDVNYNASDGGPLDVTVELEGFRMVAAPRRSVTFPGGSVPFTLTLTPENGTFAEDVAFSCSDLPPGATCNFSPSVTRVDSNGTSVSLLVNTQRPIAVAGTIVPRPPPTMLALFIAAVALAAVTLRVGRRPRLVGAALLCAAFACGGAPDELTPTEGTPPGTYTVTIGAQGTSVSRTTTVEIEVRQ